MPEFRELAKDVFDVGKTVTLSAPSGLSGDGTLLDSERMIVLYGYCELAGKLPESADPPRRNHMALLQGIAVETKLALARRGSS